MAHHTSRLLLVAAMAAAALCSLAIDARAEYPAKPVTIVSPYGPGGAADLAARTLANTATEELGQSMVPAINKRTPYKWDEYTFLGLLELNPFALTVNADGPYKTFGDLAKAIKDGAKLSYSSAGVGALQHLGMVVLLDQLGVDAAALKHVPYKGGGKAAAAVVGGHVDIFFQNLSGVISHVQGGKLRALAVTTDVRSPTAPDVPTFKELGLPGMGVILGWSGLWGPPDLPAEVTKKWESVLSQLKTDKAWLEATMKLGSVPMILPPAETKAFVEKQYGVFNEVTERLGLTIK